MSLVPFVFFVANPCQLSIKISLHPERMGAYLRNSPISCEREDFGNNRNNPKRSRQAALPPKADVAAVSVKGRGNGHDGYR